MKKLFTLFCFFVFFGLSNAQQASDYFPSQTGFEWKYKVTPLDSANNPAISLAEFRIDSFAAVGNYKGKLANIVTTKTGPFQTIFSQPYSDSLYSTTEGSDGSEYLSTKNIEAFLITLDARGVIPNFSFVNFFASLQNWYSTYRFASNVNTEYTILQKDTTISISIINLPLQFKYLGKRLQDQNLQTVLGNFDCKKFLLQWKVTASIFGDLLTLNDTIWIAPNNWIVQDIMPGQYVNNLDVLGISPFAIPGLETKLTDQLVPVELTSFASTVNGKSVNLNWTTATELNNSGFEIQRQSVTTSWRKVAFIEGNGSTTQVHSYSYVDQNLKSGKYFYRLKQIDFDGTFEYSKIVEVEVVNQIDFTLNQNYPNPFNPSTKISWQSPVGSWQTLKVFDVLGNEVATLIDEYKPAGNYEVDFPSIKMHHDASLPSGVYFYQLSTIDPSSSSTQGFVQIRKMILLK